MWRVDVNTGVIAYPTTKKRYEAEDALLTGRAGEYPFPATEKKRRKKSYSPSTATNYSTKIKAVTDCEHCTSKQSVHQGIMDFQILSCLRSYFVPAYKQILILCTPTVHPTSEVIFHNVTRSGSLEWFSFHYTAENPSSEHHITNKNCHKNDNEMC